MNDTAHRYIIIMAGGAGSRLWPLSRKNRPKQFQPLTGTETLFQKMVSQAEKVVPAERVLVMSVPEYHSLIAEQAPQLPAENLLSEPALRDNGPAIALAMIRLQQRDPEAQVAILWSDHLIQKPEVFTTTLTATFEASEAHPDCLVTVGAKPTFPNTGFGYIQMGDEIGRFADTPTFAVTQFVEKPDLLTAEKYVASWEYLWNVGYKIISLPFFFKALAEYCSDLQPTIDKLIEAVSSKNDEMLAAAYNELPRQSIEYMFTSHLKNILVVPADMGWSDVGTWDILFDELPKDENGITTQGTVRVMDTKDALIYAKDRPIAVLGMENVVVVDAGDSILVMRKDMAQDIKKFVTTFEETNPELL
jgi:mannose-1-phosphate guanylyltransferase